MSEAGRGGTHPWGVGQCAQDSVYKAQSILLDAHGIVLALDLRGPALDAAVAKAVGP